VNYIATHPGEVLSLALAHLGLVAAALAIAFAVALPLGVVAARASRFSPWLLGALAALYTIPSLALLAVLVRWLGLGATPVVVALILYAQFMLVQGVVTGIRGVDPAQIDAARGLGFSERQLMLRVALPQATPVILGGVRIATVATISIATLAGYVGARSLGTLIFNGLTLHQNQMLVAGSVATALLAILADAGLRALTRLSEARLR
jgi:osmoprotectant transport system permease protein